MHTCSKQLFSEMFHILFSLSETISLVKSVNRNTPLHSCNKLCLRMVTNSNVHQYQNSGNQQLLPDKLFSFCSANHRTFLLPRRVTFKSKERALLVSYVFPKIFNVSNIHLRQYGMNQRKQFFLNKRLLFCIACRRLTTEGGKKLKLTKNTLFQ